MEPLWICVLGGSAVLLVVSLLGELGLALALDGRGDKPQRRQGEASRQRSLARFAANLPDVEQVGEEEFLVVLCRRLGSRFEHGPGRFTVWSNYVFRWGGLFCRRLRTVENTRLLFRYCRRALCHQMAQAMVDVATEAGLKARVVGLDGHVVAEAHYGGGWHGFDPDYGVCYRDGGRILSVEEVAGDRQAAARIYRHQRFLAGSEEVLRILGRQRITAVPPGGHLSPVTTRCQGLLGGLKWILAGAGLAAAAVMLIR